MSLTRSWCAGASRQSAGAQQYSSLTELRIAVEPIAAAGAARRASAAERSQLVALAADLRRLGEAGELQAFLAADIAFHRLLLQSCGNEMFLALEGDGGRGAHQPHPAGPHALQAPDRKPSTPTRRWPPPSPAGTPQRPRAPCTTSWTKYATRWGCTRCAKSLPARAAVQQPNWGRRSGQERGCAQCAHPGLRIGSYWCRTGPDCGGFRGSGGYSRAGTRFESHLGHVFSLFRGLWASECAQTVHLWAPSGAFFVGGRCCGRRLLLVVRAAVALFTRSWPGVPLTA